jgi:chromosome segregation ATPase
MSNGPADDERLDNDPTDELPILLETVVLDPEEHSVAHQDLGDDTGEHTAHFVALSPVDGVNLDALKSDLEARTAKVEALEDNIAQLSARWLDVERHLTAKDETIDELNRRLGQLRDTLAERSAAEQRLSTEIADRDAQRRQLLDAVERARQENAVRIEELEQSRRANETTTSENAALREQLAARSAAAAAAESTELQALREENATLAAYIGNRREWWQDLDARAAGFARRITELELELEHRAARQQSAEALAEREVARAATMRAELIERARLVEALQRDLAESRGTRELGRETISTSHAELNEALADNRRLQVALAAAAAALTEEETERARLESALASALAQAQGLEAAQRATAEAAAAAAAASADPDEIEVIAQLEAEVVHKRHQVSAQLAELREREEHMERAATELEQLRRQLTETRVQLEQKRTDAAHLERTLIEKDRALEARDARITTIQHELDQKLGALQKLTAMDRSLQGLDTKMSERLRRNEPAAEHANTPVLTCLTGDLPRHYALAKKTTTIGRSSQCDIQILTHFVSREHARIVVAGGRVIVEDLGSTNGVFVNSVRVERQELRHGDLVTVGETQFRFLESMAH